MHSHGDDIIDMLVDTTEVTTPSEFRLKAENLTVHHVEVVIHDILMTDLVSLLSSDTHTHTRMMDVVEKHRA